MPNTKNKSQVCRVVLSITSIRLLLFLTVLYRNCRGEKWREMQANMENEDRDYVSELSDSTSPSNNVGKLSSRV